MSEITPPETVTACQDIEPVRMTNERHTFDKEPHHTAFAVFNNWAHHQARRLCDRGSCVTGTCRGHVDVTDWKVVAEDDKTFTCEFSAEFFCRCH